MDTLQGAAPGVNGSPEPDFSKLEGPSQAVSDALTRLIGYPPENAPKRTRRTAESLYASIDVHKAKVEAWPDVVPSLTAVEATRAARRLYKRFYLAQWYRDRNRTPPRTQREHPVQVTSGRRYNWVRHGILIVNPSGGWRKLVHDFSHFFHGKLRPDDRPHSDNHRHLEKEMISYVIEHGWLDGALRPKTRVMKAPPAPKPPVPPKPKLSVKERNEAKVTAALVRWEDKLRQAQRALKRAKAKVTELRAKKRRYDKEIRFSLTD